MIRRAAESLAVAVLLASGIYTVVYLYRWEWNRALFTSIVFLATEVGLATMMVIRRLQRLEQREVRASASPRDRLRESRPRRDHFAWLEREMSRSSVLITVLLSAGVLLSVITWLVDRVAGRTALPVLESALAARLERAAFPAEPLVPTDNELLAQGGPYGEDQIDLFLGPIR